MPARARPIPASWWLVISLILWATRVGAAGHAWARTRPAARDTRQTILSGGRTRTYVLHLPQGREDQSSLPLILVLHGGGGTAVGIQRVSGMNQVADREGFVVAYPQGTGWRNITRGTWNAGGCCGYAMNQRTDDVGFLRAVMDEIERTHHTDPARVYVTGISNGGMMAYRLACELADRIAAIAPVAGALNYALCAPTQPVSVVIFHGTADQHVPYKGGQGAAAREVRIDPPVSAAVSFWTTQNRCAPAPVVDVRGTVKREQYQGCAQQTDVVLYTIEGQGHAWPGGQRGWRFGDVPSRALSSSEAMWAFFARHRRRENSS